MQEWIKKWRRWSGDSAGRRIFSALVSVFSATSLVKLVGGAKVVLIAHYYGVGDELDAFLIAFLLPSFLADLLAAAAGSAVVPAYVRAREKEGHMGAVRLLGTLQSLFLGFCLALLFGLLILADPMVRVAGSGFDENKVALTRSLLNLLAPTLVLGGMGSLWRAVLNAERLFALPAAVFGLTPVATIVAVVVAGHGRNPMALAYGTLAGSALEALVLAVLLCRCKLSPRPRWAGLDEGTRQVIVQGWPMMAGSLLLTATAYINQSMAAMLGPGSVSAFSYGSRLVSMLMAVGPAALGSAVMPHYAEMVARRQWEELKGTFREYRRNTWWLTVPATALLMWVSEPLVRILLQRGQFEAGATPQVVEVQQFLLLQIPASMPTVMMSGLLSALQKNRVLMAGSALSLGVNILLNWLLMKQMGVAGIGLATSIVSFVYFCYLSRMLSCIDMGGRRLAETEAGAEKSDDRGKRNQ